MKNIFYTNLFKCQVQYFYNVIECYGIIFFKKTDKPKLISHFCSFLFSNTDVLVLI